jgi:hypothetical protein
MQGDMEIYDDGHWADLVGVIIDRVGVERFLGHVVAALRARRALCPGVEGAWLDEVLGGVGGLDAEDIGRGGEED